MRTASQTLCVPCRKPVLRTTKHVTTTHETLIWHDRCFTTQAIRTIPPAVQRPFLFKNIATEPRLPQPFPTELYCFTCLTKQPVLIVLDKIKCSVCRRTLIASGSSFYPLRATMNSDTPSTSDPDTDTDNTTSENEDVYSDEYL